MRTLRRPLVVAFALALLAAGCGVQTDPARSGTILAVGAENQYANVLSQVGGKYVTAVAIMSNPNTDPHTFEASPSVQDRGRIAESLAEGDRRAEAARAAGLHRQPPPLVQA
jgi:zinc/manganese transport system substrate-binding protein